MTANGWYQPTFISNHLAKKLVDLDTDEFLCGLISGPYGDLAARSVTEGYEFVSTLLANNGTALTETTGTGYSRLELSSVTFTLSGLVLTFTAANLEWNPATFNAGYAWIHDETASSGTDATRPLLAIYDLGEVYSPSGQPFILEVNASGIYTETVSQ